MIDKDELIAALSTLQRYQNGIKANQKNRPTVKEGRGHLRYKDVLKVITDLTNTTTF